MRSPLLYLSEMLSAAITVKDFIEGMDKNEFSFYSCPYPNS